MNQFIDFQQQYLDQFNTYLHKQLVNRIKQPQVQVGMLYSLDAGGKRIRPFLMLATLQSLKPEALISDYFPIAGAIELIHTYSLIHDDLPEMDNDDYRRGQLSNHKRFTPARAILVGDALLTEAFIWLTDNFLPATLQSSLIQILAQAAGGNGMIAGQMLDIVNTGRNLSLKQIIDLDLQKTGALIRASVLMGAICAQAKQPIKAALDNFALNFGIAFQIYDDLLDVTSTQEQVGKKVGKDQSMGKNTYVQALGVFNAQTKLRLLVQKAKYYLDTVDLKNSILSDSLKYFD